MRIADVVSVQRINSSDDGFGGKVFGTPVTFDVPVKVNVTNDELRSQSSGYGYYRKLTFVASIESGILTGDTVIYRDVAYSIEEVYPIKNDTYKVFKGYEV